MGIKYDSAKCLSDYDCVNVCPTNVFKIQTASAGLPGYETPVDSMLQIYSDDCISCGDCVSACFFGALSLDDDSPGGVGGGGGSTGGGGGSLPKNNLINNLTNPCFKAAFNAFSAANLQSHISQIYRKISNSQDVTVTIDQATLASNIDADTRTSLSGGFLKFDITLNQSKLLYSSQEYIVSTLMHEVLHAYFKTLNLTSFLDHDTMALYYLDQMTEGLLEVFPNMNADDAVALSWGGLQETYSWSELVRLNNSFAQSVIDINNEYKNGQEGTSCQ